MRSRGHLVAADHQRLRVARGHRLRLGQCQAHRPIHGQLCGKRRLLHPGGFGLKGQPESSEQLTAVAGSGGEDQGRRMAHCGTRITFEKQGVSDKNSFDLGRPDTYYTRPISPPWSKPLEVDRLADGGADVDFAIPLAELSGLRPLRAGVAGSVQGRAHFTRQRGLPVAELALAGEATLPVPALPAADAAAAALAGCAWHW